MAPTVSGGAGAHGPGLHASMADGRSLDFRSNDTGSAALVGGNRLRRGDTAQLLGLPRFKMTRERPDLRVLLGNHSPAMASLQLGEEPRTTYLSVPADAGNAPKQRERPGGITL